VHGNYILRHDFETDHNCVFGYFVFSKIGSWKQNDMFVVGTRLIPLYLSVLLNANKVCTKHTYNKQIPQKLYYALMVKSLVRADNLRYASRAQN